ncbi:MAG: hypothetical protein FWE53_02935 [Firmicutes bacterium]|nr:hypothetical protein [Bacillota bacterium]
MLKFKACCAAFAAAVFITGVAFGIAAETKTATYAEDAIYYRIITGSSYLYRTPSESVLHTNLFFSLPETYFVEFVSESWPLFLEVNYNGIRGYVLKTDVQRVYGAPVTPYAAGIMFQIEGIANAIVRSRPDTGTGAYLGVVPYNASGVEYLGSINGQEAVSGLGTTWYFARYNSAEQGILTGYIYAALAAPLPNLAANPEILPIVPPDTGGGGVVLPPELNDPNSWLLLGLLSIPAIFLLFMLFKPIKKGKTRRTAPTTQQVIPVSTYNRGYITQYQAERPRDFDF